MKNLFILVFSLCLGLASSAQTKRAAILVTHYGSSDTLAREQALDIITKEIKEAYPNYEVREAYISPVVRKKLRNSGIHKDSPLDALLKLRSEGYKNIYLQSTTLIEGNEMQSVRQDVEKVKSFFDQIKVGEPLLFTTDDCDSVINILLRDKPETKHDYIYIGHGNKMPSTATYAMLDYMIKSRGIKNYHVSTIEGYPTIETTIQQLKETYPKRVTLIPLLLVNGNHTKEDIAIIWKKELEHLGYKVDIIMRGLGENPLIRKLYINHIKKILSY